jgi:CHASE2 domain-containing sensor protein
MSNEVYWFRRKRFGWGWGLPSSWQGWAFFIPWLAMLIYVTFHFMPQRPFAFTMALGALTAILVVVCVVKGEPPR